MALKRNNPVRHILITAGPTREMLDPVRFITNLSTGEMGYAIAREAKRKGLKVTLISGPTALNVPKGIRFVPIVSVSDLDGALGKHFPACDLLVMAAAVGDFIPLRRSSQKIHRGKKWSVEFRQAPDLVRKVAAKKETRLVVGFSLETQDWLRRSHAKLAKKKLDGIVANYFTGGHNPFGKTDTHVALIDRKRTQVLHFPSKTEFARRLLGWAVDLKKYS